MFLSIYKTTIKNLLRSLMFWMAVGLVIGITFYKCKNGVYSMYSYSYKEIIYDTDPRFVLELNPYKNLIGNVCISFVMYYAMPIFTVISTVLVLNRDYGDQFFEIEKAGGVRSWKYTGGRISALVTVNFALVFIACFLGVWLYLLTRVGPEGVYKMETGELLWDSAKRLIRFIAFMPLPTTLFYISFTYFLGNIFKNGWIGGFGGMSHIIATYLFGYQLRFRLPDRYHDYFSINNAQKIRSYLSRCSWDTDFEIFIDKSGTSIKDAALCFSFVTGLAIIMLIISYIRVRKRSV